MNTYDLINRDFRNHQMIDPLGYNHLDCVDHMHQLEYFNLKKAFKKIGDTVGDIAKGVVKLSVAPVNAVTGHEYDPKMSTKIGKGLEWAGDAAEDAQTTFYGLQTPTETKFGTAIGNVGNQIIKYIPIAGQIHQAVTPLFQKINADQLGINDNQTIPTINPGPSEKTLEDQLKENIVPISIVGGSMVLLIILVIAIK